MDIKVCFVHVSREKKDPSIKLLPLGMVAIADFLFKNGFNSLIIHLGLEKTLNPRFNLKEYIVKNQYSVILFDLYWYQQSYDVIETIRDLKRNVKDIKVAVGGFTASFFSNEIMQKCKEIDFIIRGDSEMPLLQLLNNLRDHRLHFYDVPNLIWRKGRKLICNSHDYIINHDLISKLYFTNFKLICNYKKYFELISTDLDNRYRGPVFYYVPGRGCMANCSFCGGGCSAQKIINNRKEVVFIDINSVVRDLKELKRYNIDRVHIGFVSLPNSTYYMHLFRRIRRNKLKLYMDFEYFGLPRKQFIDEFVKTFRRDSSIALSPESGSYNIRKRNKGMPYSNDDLIKILSYVSKKNIKLYLSFTAGLPFETKKDVIKTLTLINFIKGKLKDIEMRIGVIEVEPASPWSLYAEKYAILNSRDSFMDFYNTCKSNSSLGYHTQIFSEDDIKAIAGLYRAEIHCIYKKSKFLTVLANSHSMMDFDVGSLHSFCRECSQYNRCFKDKVKYAD